MSDPAGAVDVYCKFPMPDEPSFDDAFILGEMVRLFMKMEKFDDPRLGTTMIFYGRVLGLGKMEIQKNRMTKYGFEGGRGRGGD